MKPRHKNGIASSLALQKDLHEKKQQKGNKEHLKFPISMSKPHSYPDFTSHVRPVSLFQGKNCNHCCCKPFWRTQHTNHQSASTKLIFRELETSLCSKARLLVSLVSLIKDIICSYKSCFFQGKKDIYVIDTST